MICVFSGVGAVGGIQASGWEAWRAFQDVAEGRRAIVFGPDQTGELARCPETAVVSQDRLSLARAVLARKWRGETALFWHLGLLKLLPIMRGFRGRVVLFLHGIEAWQKPSWATSLLLRRVDQFLTNSQFTWERFLDFAPQFASARHSVVPLGIGENALPHVAEPTGVPTAIVIGRLAREEKYSKGHRELIWAWPTVREWCNGAQLLVVGDGSLRPELESLARSLGLADSVRFLGWLSEAEKRAAIERARCLAMPSRGEGFGLVYLEAMRLGRPCLVSDWDAGREVVRPPTAGLAVTPGDPREVAQALIELMTMNPRWKEWSKAARCRFENQFTAAHFHERLRRAMEIPNTYPSVEGKRLGAG
jgi:phosphatidyl-myo-inositol dimannoside synthase